eukprot:691418-Rhodomonas_salina.1
MWTWTWRVTSEGETAAGWRGGRREEGAEQLLVAASSSFNPASSPTRSSFLLLLPRPSQTRTSSWCVELTRGTVQVRMLAV